MHEADIATLIFPVVKEAMIHAVLEHGRSEGHVVIAQFDKEPLVSEISSRLHTTLVVHNREEFAASNKTAIRPELRSMLDAVLAKLDTCDPAQSAIGMIVIDGTPRLAKELRLD